MVCPLPNIRGTGIGIKSLHHNAAAGALHCPSVVSEAFQRFRSFQPGFRSISFPQDALLLAMTVTKPEFPFALDAHVCLEPADTTESNSSRRRPYPEELEEWITWNDQRVLLRPIKPDDLAQYAQFFDALDAGDIRSRTFMPLRELTPAQLARFTHIDFDREMAFIATRQREEGREETLGVVRCVAGPDNKRAELGIIVRSDLKRQGLGSILLQKLIDYARNRGIKELFGDALAENRSVIEFMKQFGFRISRSCDGWTVPLVLTLRGEGVVARTS
jgi:GNAT superfamily N-acetyltransferase